MEQIQHCNGWPPGHVSSQTPFWWTAVHYHSYFWILCREALLHWTMANVFHFQVWAIIFVGETNTGFPHDCSGFDLLGETGVKKAAGMVLLLGNQGLYCSENIQKISIGLLLSVQTILGKNELEHQLISENFFQFQPQMLQMLGRKSNFNPFSIQFHHNVGWRTSVGLHL